MSGILHFACVQNLVWTPVAREIHSAIWDRVGLEIVQGRVREWATTWNDKAKAFAIEQEKHNEIRKNDADWCSDWYPVFPAMPLPPSNESISIAEKWASLAAIHDVFGFTGDKVLPWPLPKDDHDLVAYTEWLKGDAGAYQLLLRRANELPESYAETVRYWLEYVKKHTHIAKAGGTPEDGRHGAGTVARNKLSIVLGDWVVKPKLEADAFNRYQDQISDLVQAASVELKSCGDVANEPISNSFLSKPAHEVDSNSPNTKEVAKAGDTPETNKQETAIKPPKVSVNARMIDRLQRDPDSAGWSIRQWVEAMGCRSTSTIHRQPTWKAMQLDKSGRRNFTIDPRADLD
jgi:hypothetical protein